MHDILAQPCETVRAAGEGDDLTNVAGRLTYEQRSEVGRTGGRSEILGVAGVGAVQHPDAAVRPRLLGRPLDGIVAVLVVTPAVIATRIEGALGAESAAHALPDHD